MIDFKENINGLILYLIKNYEHLTKDQIQKLFYFFNIIMKENLIFHVYFFGPYSEIVENSIDELYVEFYINIKRNRNKPDTYFIDDNCLNSHSQSDNEKVDELLKKFIEENDLRQFAELIEVFKNDLQSPDEKELGMAAKSHFCLENYNINHVDYKYWSITEKQLKKAQEILVKVRELEN